MSSANFGVKPAHSPFEKEPQSTFPRHAAPGTHVCLCWLQAVESSACQPGEQPKVASSRTAKHPSSLCLSPTNPACKTHLDHLGLAECGLQHTGVHIVDDLHTRTQQTAQNVAAKQPRPWWTPSAACAEPLLKLQERQAQAHTTVRRPVTANHSPVLLHAK